MRFPSFLLLGSAAALALAVLGPVRKADAKPAWKPLFNGKSFKPEWRFVGDSTFWTIDPRDSSIVGFSNSKTTPHSMLFSSRKDYDEFTVKYSYRLKAGCSGFWFRSHDKASPTTVDGPQVEIKREGAELLEVGSIYTWPTPGWEVQHSRAYSVRVAPKVDEYQEVVLTVKKPNVYVNVNGSQAIGETDAAALSAGAKPAWNYTNSTYAKLPGSFGLQVHEGYEIDIRFRNIMILEGCNDPQSPNYDGAFVQGFSKQPAVYQDNGSCAGTAVAPSPSGPGAAHLGTPQRTGEGVSLEVSFPGPHSLEILGLDGRAIFTGSAPGANAYRLSAQARPGVYFARLVAGGKSSIQRILIP